MYITEYVYPLKNKISFYQKKNIKMYLWRLLLHYIGVAEKEICFKWDQNEAL